MLPLSLYARRRHPWRKAAVDLGGENGPDSITSKADVVKFLKDSFAYLHKAMISLNESNVLGQVQTPFGSNKITRLDYRPSRSVTPWITTGRWWNICG